jgi:hypothetical protein
MELGFHARTQLVAVVRSFVSEVGTSAPWERWKWFFGGCFCYLYWFRWVRLIPRGFLLRSGANPVKIGQHLIDICIFGDEFQCAGDWVVRINTLLSSARKGQLQNNVASELLQGADWLARWQENNIKCSRCWTVEWRPKFCFGRRKEVLQWTHMGRHNQR